LNRDVAGTRQMKERGDANSYESIATAAAGLQSPVIRGTRWGEEDGEKRSRARKLQT